MAQQELHSVHTCIRSNLISLTCIRSNPILSVSSVPFPSVPFPQGSFPSVSFQTCIISTSNLYHFHQYYHSYLYHSYLDHSHQHHSYQYHSNLYQVFPPSLDHTPRSPLPSLQVSQNRNRSTTNRFQSRSVQSMRAMDEVLVWICLAYLGHKNTQVPQGFVDLMLDRGECCTFPGMT